MALMHPQVLRRLVARLLEDVGPIGTVSAVGYEGGPDAEESLQAVAADARWGFADLRAAAADAPRPPWKLGKDALVVAVQGRRPPRALVALVGELLDRREKPAVPRSLILLCEGCADVSYASAELQRVPYWDIVP